MISEYDFTYKQFVKYCVSNKKSYIMFIKNSYDDYYYTPRTKIELLRAIKMWCERRQDALKKYNHISTWNITYINDLSSIFLNRLFFRDNIGEWNVSNVYNFTNMFYDNKYYNKKYVAKWRYNKEAKLRVVFYKLTL